MGQMHRCHRNNVTMSKKNRCKIHVFAFGLKYDPSLRFTHLTVISTLDQFAIFMDVQILVC